MIFQWSDALSLRTKATVVVCSVMILGLGTVAAVGLQQTRGTIVADEARTAQAVAGGIGRAAELALAVGDNKELSRLATRSLQDEQIMLVAVYDAAGALLAHSSRDAAAWDAYVQGHLEEPGVLLGEQNVELSAETDEFAGASAEPPPPSSRKSPSSPAPRILGRVVVGLSTHPALLARQHQTRLMILSTLAATSLSMALVYILLGSWTRRLGQLVTASARISSGDLTHLVPENRRDEIGRLGQAYEQMRAAVQQRDQDLRRFNETLQQQVQERTGSLEEALHAAQAADKAKSRFLANMSHEIRTPLNGVVGMIDLLRGTELDENQRRYAQIARTSADSLLSVINDILDFSKIEAGRMELENVDFDLRAIIEDVAETASLTASKKGIELVCSIQPTLPRSLTGDPGRFRQILLNLVNNALKFTKEGQVVIRLTAEARETSKTHLHVSVSDTGIGIPPDLRDKLFHSFSQVDASTTRQFGGTGLGLAICKRLVELMAGTIGVESEVGRGSTFWFQVTLRTPEAIRPETPSHRPPGDLRKLRVLAVDDNSVNLEIILQQLLAWNLRAVAATDGNTALDLLRQGARENDPFDLAILDWHMPGMDGIELARHIRNDVEIRRIALIMLTSIEDKLRATDWQAMGFNGCLLKPVRQSLLFDTIADAVKKSTADSAPADSRPAAVKADSAAAAARAGVCILVAEDNEINQLVAAAILTKSGYCFDTVENGRRALEAVFEKHYDLVLMDCQMPVMDGFEATRAIRRREQELHRPAAGRIQIVALTANAIKGDREQCLAAGMDDYVAKPINPEALHQAIARALSKRPAPEPAPTARVQALPGISGALKAFLRDPSAGPEAALDPEQVAKARSATDLPVDLADLRARCMNDVQLTTRMLERFKDRLTGDVETLSRTLGERRVEEAQRLAHGLKGSAATLSANKLRFIAEEIEMICKGNRIEEAARALEQLAAEARRCVEFIPGALSRLGPGDPADRLGKA